MNWLVKLITNIDTIVKAVKSVKTWINEAVKRHRARKIRNAVDSGDVDSVRDVLQSIKDKKQKREDSH